MFPLIPGDFRLMYSRGPLLRQIPVKTRLRETGRTAPWRAGLTAARRVGLTARRGVGGPAEEDGTLARVAGQGGGALELGARLRVAAQPGQQVAANAGQ